MEKYSKEWWKKWIKAAGIRAVKTMAQGAVGAIGTGAIFLHEVNWLAVLSTAVLAGIVSLLNNIGGLPEMEE